MIVVTIGSRVIKEGETLRLLTHLAHYCSEGFVERVAPFAAIAELTVFSSVEL